MPPSQHIDQRGAACTFFAYFLWGVFPLYFKQLTDVPALEIIVHRILWAACCLIVLLAVTKRLGALRSTFGQPRLLGALALSALAVGLNWTIFAWAVTHDQVLNTSLGYFINPILSVLLGMLVLRERLRKAQALAVVFAALGVCLLIVRHGSLPWVALGLALSFGAYGLLRKQIDIDPLVGLLIETLTLAPLALAWWAWLIFQNASHFSLETPQRCAWLLLAGPVTIAPLICFAAGVRRIPLWTVGLLQYITPSMTFLMAIFLFKEPFQATQLLTFLFIWAGLLVFSIDTWRSKQFGPGAPLEE